MPPPHPLLPPPAAPSPPPTRHQRHLPSIPLHLQIRRHPEPASIPSSGGLKPDGPPFFSDPDGFLSSSPSAPRLRRHPFLLPDPSTESVSSVSSPGRSSTPPAALLPHPDPALSALPLDSGETPRDLLKNLKRHHDEDAIKGQAVKNQKALWDKALELRFLLQKAFASSNKLPQEPVRSQFCNTEGVVAQAYTYLISSSEQTLNSMLELQKALVEKNPAIIEGTEDGLVAFRNNSVDKWQRKTQVATGAAAFKGKLQAFNQNISEQVAGYMRDPCRMIKRMQLRASTVAIFGKVPGDSESKDTDENADGNPELLDDSEFYQQLLKEFFESCDLASSEKAFYDLKRLQPKKRKIVDRRASKSRKIRYNVHEKIVNFMAPLPLALPPMAPKLFANLFGFGHEKPTST